MAKSKTVYLDDDGGQHDTDQAAERANARLRAQKVFDQLGMPRSLILLEGVNHETLAPLQAYIDLLVRESMERTENYG